MLHDRSRKLLTTFFHLTRLNGEVPSIEELCKKMRKTPQQIKLSLQELSDGGYIIWSKDNHEATKIIQPSVNLISATPIRKSWEFE